MEISFLHQHQVDKDFWNKGINNPTQLYEFSYTKSSKFTMPIFLIIKTEKHFFKWQFYLVGTSLFRYIEIISEPNILETDLLNKALKEIIKRFSPFKVLFYAITLSKMTNRTFFEMNKFNRIYDFGSSIVDLSLPEEQLFQNIHPKHRNSIKKAEKDGVVIFEDTTLIGIREFHKIAIETYKRSNKRGLDINYLIKHFNALKDSKNIRIFFAKKENVIQAGAIFLVSNNMSIYWHGASINNPSSGSTNLLHWEAIKIFKSAGLKFFDLGGLSLNTSDEKAQSISRFKIRFGGEVKMFYGGVKIINKFKNYLFEVIKKWK